MKDIVLYPSFDATEFTKYKKRLLLQLERDKENPAGVINNYADAFLYGAHPYGNATTGSKNSVDALTIEDVKAFYKANYKPAESAFAIVGDFKTPLMKKLIIRMFNDWEDLGKSTPVAATPLPTFSTSRVLLVNKEDAMETQFVIGQLGIKRSNPDYVAIEVINTVLGGRFTSWLNDTLRVNAGLTYGAISMFSPHKEVGPFIISSYTPTTTTIEAIDLALKVLDRLHTEGIDENTLTSAKKLYQRPVPPPVRDGWQSGEFVELNVLLRF